MTAAALIERINDGIVSISLTIGGAILGAASWIVRRILTNQKQLEILHTELHHRDEQRLHDREMWIDMQRDLKEVRIDVQDTKVQIARIQAKGDEHD